MTRGPWPALTTYTNAIARNRQARLLAQRQLFGNALANRSQDRPAVGRSLGAAPPHLISVRSKPMEVDGREVLGWEEFGVACRSLARQVADSGYRPTIILGVARGGLLPAAAIAYALGVKNVFAMNVEFYTGVDQRLNFPVMLPPLLNAVDIAGSRVLIADDVADTGATLRLVNEFCAAHVADVRSAVIYEKGRSQVRCEYVWRRTDRWIDFPWSRLPPVTAGESSREGEPLVSD